MGLDEIRTKFEKMMGDAWEKYDSSGYEADLEDYGEDYEKAYDYLFGALEADYIPRATVMEIIGGDNYAPTGSQTAVEATNRERQRLRAALQQESDHE